MEQVMSTSDERQAAGADADAGGKAAASGPVFRPGDPGYNAERAGYNVALDGRPERVVGAVSAQDVRRAVSSAANDDLAVGVQAPGPRASGSPRGGGLYFPLEAAAEVLDAYRRWTATVPDEMSSSVLLIRYPDDPGLPEPLRGLGAVHVRLAYSGLGEPHGAASDGEGERLVSPLRDVGPRLMDTVRHMPYVEVPSIYDDPTDPAPVYDRNL